MSYSRYRPYNSSRRRAIGNARAANQQADSTEILISTDIDVSCGQTLTEINKHIDEYGDLIVEYLDTGCAAINIYNVLFKSEYFQNYSSLYDQFKIDSIKVKVSAVNWATGSNDQNGDEYISPKSLIICTAWDRSGLSLEQFIEQKDDQGQSLKFPVYYCTIGRDITTYSSAQTKHLGPGNTYSITRYLYPSTIQEKEQYLSTLDLNEQFIRTNKEGFEYSGFITTSRINDRGNIVIKRKNTDLNEGYPCNLIESPGVPFKPTFLIDVIASDEPKFIAADNKKVNLLRPTTFNLEFDIVVKFRGLRYTKFVE